MLYHINSYFLHASKLSNFCYKLSHGFYRFYINFKSDFSRVPKINWNAVKFMLCYLKPTVSQLGWYWETEKVMGTRTVTLSLSMMISYKILFRWRTAMSRVQKEKKNRMLKFRKFQPLIPKYPLKHQYLLETSYIKMSRWSQWLALSTSIKTEV